VKTITCCPEFVGDPLKHPMFATSSEDLVGNPLADALRALREEDKTLVQIATMYKEDANALIKKSKDSTSSSSTLHEAVNTYLHAVSFVDQAIAARANGTESEQDTEVNLDVLKSQLYSNIAQVWLTLKNYRSCIQEADKAIAVWRGNSKAHYRKCKALLQLKKYDECVAACIASAEHNNSADQAFIDEIMNTCNSEIQKKALREQQNRTARLAVQKEWGKVWIHVVKRNGALKESNSAAASRKMLGAEIKFGFCNDILPVQLNDHYPCIDEETKMLCVPILLLYPQYNQLDVIQSAKTDVLLVEYLAEMFPEFDDSVAPVSWDTNKEYQSSSLVVYCPVYQSVPVTTMNEWIQCCTERRQIQGLEGEEAAQEARDALSERNKRFNASASSSSAAEQVVTNKKGFVEVHVGCSVEQVLRLDGCLLAGGVLTLLAFVKGNAAHKEFLKKSKDQDLTLLKLQPNEVISKLKEK
jgi:hypothetical protein